MAETDENTVEPTLETKAKFDKTVEFKAPKINIGGIYLMNCF